ncbi:hypothetical protein GGI20_004042 [Coemansia sp. BCRC 34301]|nr:hypothetical protein GGI20_004042 [Coemansia sp. BCRC 34301]
MEPDSGRHEAQQPLNKPVVTPSLLSQFAAAQLPLAARTTASLAPNPQTVPAAAKSALSSLPQRFSPTGSNNEVPCPPKNASTETLAPNQPPAKDPLALSDDAESASDDDQLFCCHYKSDKAARNLVIIGKESEPHYVHIQCAVWNPDIDTSHIPFTTTLRKVKVSYSVCCFCNGRFGYQLHCAHIENGVPCDTSFHPMCAFRHGVLDPPTDYSTKFNICFCPTHTEDADTALSIDSRRAAASHEEELVSSLARRKTLPSYSPSNRSGALSSSDVKPESVRLSTVQAWPNRGAYRTARLTSRSTRPVTQSATTVRRAGRLPFSLDDDSSDATRSGASPTTSITPSGRHRGRPYKNLQSMDVNDNTDTSASRRISTRASAPVLGPIEEESVISSGFVPGPPSSRRGSLVRESNAKSPKSSKVLSHDPSIEQVDASTSAGPKLKLSLSRVDKAAETSAVQPSTRTDMSGSARKDVPLPTAPPTVAPLPPVGSFEAPPLRPCSSNEQLSPYAALAKRPNIRIKPFSQSSSMSPVSATIPGTYSHLAANRGYSPLALSADSHTRSSPTFGLSGDQANMLKESHSMLRKQNEMLGNICDMIKGLSINPAQRAQEAMSAISSLSALVSSDAAPRNGLLPPSATGPPLLALPQQQDMLQRQHEPQAQPHWSPHTRLPGLGMFQTHPPPAPPAPARSCVQAPTLPHRPSLPTDHTQPLPPRFHAPSVESHPPLSANRHHGFKPIMPSQGPREIAPWTGASSSTSGAKRRRTSSSNEQRGNGPSSCASCRCRHDGASPSLSPMGQSMSPADIGRRPHSEKAISMNKEPLDAITDSIRQPFMRSTCIQAGPTMLDYANPIVDMDIEMDDFKENVIYLIQGINMPRILLDMVRSQSVSHNAANEHDQAESVEHKVALNLLMSELKGLGKLTTYNVPDYVKILVDSLQAMRRCRN